MTTIFHAKPYGTFIEIKSNLKGKKLHRTNQSSHFLGGSFSDRDSVRAPIQLRRERNPQHLKILFFLQNIPTYFHIYGTRVIRLVKRKKLHSSSIAINKSLPVAVQCFVSHIQVQKPTLAVATDQMPDHTQSSKQCHQHRQQYYR